MMINWLLDLLAGGAAVYWLINFKKLWLIVRKDRFNRYFWLFVFVGLVALIFSPINLTLTEKIISLGYLARLAGYWFFYGTAKVLKTPKIINYLGWLGLVWAIIGWGQYFFYPDLRPLEFLGWDPHYKRIFGLFFDPNFMGIMMVLSLLVWLWQKPSRLVWLIRVFLLLTLAFTYSRGSFLALAGAGVYYSLGQKRYKLIGLIGLISLLCLIGLPRPEGEGVKLERTASIEARLTNWQEGWQLFWKYPVLGVGYNTLRYARNQPAENHAGAGWDNSLLVVATTTGVIGLAIFLFFLRAIWQTKSLLIKVTLLAIIIHSLFINSLFFPWVMLWGWVIIGTNQHSYTV
jgi:hypothetical protein